MPTAPGPDLRDLLNDLTTLRDDPLRFFVELADRYGDLVRMPFGPKRFAFVISAPEHVQHILQDQARRYSKDTFQYTTLSLVTGQGLLTSDGAFWLRQRRLMQPAFHREHLAGFAMSMRAAADRLADRWLALPEGTVVDVDGAMLAASLEIVGDTLFSANLQDSAPELVAAVITALDHVIARSRNPVWPPAWLPTAANRAFKASIATLDDAVARLVAERRAGPPRRDLLQMLLDARDDDSQPMSEKQLRDELVTLLVAGHETVASALTWAWALLAQHPAAADRVAAEATPDGLDPRTLPFAAAVFDEALRLYPPAWLITRKAIADDVLGDVPVPAGSLAIISPYVAHRRAERWPEPGAFRPERFLDAAPPRFAYLPFGAGPRLCIGQSFARIEGTLILSALARRLRLELTPQGVPAVEPLVTLRPHGGLKLRVSQRLSPGTSALARSPIEEPDGTPLLS